MSRRAYLERARLAVISPNVRRRCCFVVYLRRAFLFASCGTCSLTRKQTHMPTIPIVSSLGCVNRWRGNLTREHVWTLQKKRRRSCPWRSFKTNFADREVAHFLRGLLRFTCFVCVIPEHLVREGHRGLDFTDEALPLA